MARTLEEKKQRVITHDIVRFAIIHCVAPSPPYRAARTLMNEL